VIIEKYRSPASVSVTLRPVRAISVVPSWPSSNCICWETAEGVTLNSSAALEMLPALAAAWKTRIDFIGICMGSFAQRITAVA